MRLPFLLTVLALGLVACNPPMPSDPPPVSAVENTNPDAEGIPSEKPIPDHIENLYIRAFKTEKELEIWVQSAKGEKYVLHHTYPVLRASGRLGPKRKEGDGQVPEGLYHVDRFNPNSKFHLSLGLNYPNKSDLKRSDPTEPGSDIFIHGSNVSIGCLAMGNEPIEEIYAIAEKAKTSGNKIRVDIYPFRMTDQNMAAYSEKFADHLPFWQNELKPFYISFETNRTLTGFSIERDGRYSLE